MPNSQKFCWLIPHLFLPIVMSSLTAAEIENVVLLVSDDLKASALGCYGNEVCQTPNIDRLAAEGVVFENAYCQGTHCAPSRLSFMFSRYTGEGEVNLGEHFRNHGYYSARVGKIYHMKVPGDIIAGTDGRDHPSSWSEKFNSPGLEAHTPGDYACLNLNIFTDELEGRQSTAMPHRMFVTVKYEGDGSDQPDAKSAAKAIELLREHQSEKFFLAVGMVRPHYPMVAPHQYFEPYPWENIEMPPTVENDYDDIPKMGLAGTRSSKNPIGKYPDNQKRMWTGYYAAVHFMDEQIGRILDELDRLKIRDKTAIVFISDHGYHLGEHGFWQKANLHEEVTRVPLVISVPGMPAGRTKSLAELADIFPTLSEVVGLEIPKSVQGKSLVPVLKNSHATVRDSALSIDRSGHSIRTSDWAFMKYKDGTTEMYDMREDPHQFTNLTDSPDHQQTRKRLEQELDERVKSVVQWKSN